MLGVVLADGWWSGYVGFDPRRQALHYGDAPQAIVQVLLDFADGSRRWIGTGEGWRECSGAIKYADLLMGEYVDARDALPGWDTPPTTTAIGAMRRYSTVPPGRCTAPPIVPCG